MLDLALRVYWRRGCSSCVKWACARCRSRRAGATTCSPRRWRTCRATPGRERNFRDLACHVYQIAEALLAAVEEGDPDLATRYNAPAPKRLAAWWASLPDKSCRQTVSTYYGERPLHELLERCAWHSAQHARQLIAVLERFGIAVDGPLTAQDYAGLPLPAGLWE